MNAGLRRADVEVRVQWHDPDEWQAVERPMRRVVAPAVQALFMRIIRDCAFLPAPVVP